MKENNGTKELYQNRNTAMTGRLASLVKISALVLYINQMH